MSEEKQSEQSVSDEARYPLAAGVHRSELKYGPDPLQSIDLFAVNSPAAPAELMVAPSLLVFVHGGLWCSGDKAEGYLIARHFSAPPHRAVVACINYPLSPPPSDDGSVSGPVHPFHTLELCSALRFLLTHSAALPAPLFDPSRIAFIGHSVGAHMAAALALDPVKYPWFPDRSAPRVRGVCGLQGIYSLRAFCEEKPEWKKYIVATCGPDAANWTSPSDLLADSLRGPPPAAPEPVPPPNQQGPGPVEWLLVHSLQDPWVDVTQSRTLARLLQGSARPARVELTVLECGGLHDEALQFIGRSADDIERRVAARTAALPSGQAVETALSSIESWLMRCTA